MVCSNCKSETNGLKLNNRLYCTECGFLLSPPEPEEAKPAEIETPVAEPEIGDSRTQVAPEPEAKIIPEGNEEFALAPLEAEEEVLDLVLKEAKKLEKENKDEKEDIGAVEVNLKAKLPHTTHSVKKHNRPRTDLKKEGDFVLVPGELDPIAEPEIEAAEETVEIPIKVPKAKKVELEKEEPKEPPIPVVVVEDPAEPEKEEEYVEDADKKHAVTKEKPKNANPNSELLLSYFKQQVAKKPNDQPKNKKKKRKKKFRWGLFLGIMIPTLILLGLVGLVFYVNLYAGKPSVAVTRAEKSANFQHLKADYIPPGYAPSFKTNGTANFIEYVYDYQPDKTKIFTVKAEKTSLATDDIRPKVIDPLGLQFVNTTEGGRSLWFVGDDRLYLIENGVLYTISSNSDIQVDELTKVAVGLK